MGSIGLESLDEFYAAYVECALWASPAYLIWDDKDNVFQHDSDDDRSFSDHNLDADDLEEGTAAKMRADCEDFLTSNLGLLQRAEEVHARSEWSYAAQAGHDFWLTRHHHGAGFWDRGLGVVGDDLTKAAHPYGDFNLWFSTTDDKIHGE